MAYTTLRTTGEIKLTDYEITHVRFLFHGNPYGLTATDLATAQTVMEDLSQDMADLSGLAVNGMEFAIDFEVSPDVDKPLVNSHVEWIALIACEAIMPSGSIRNRILQIPIPDINLFVNINELDLNNIAIKNYARLYTELAPSLGGSAATLRGGAVIDHNAFEDPILAATLKIHHPKIT